MKGNVSVELRDKDGNIKKTVEGHNAICAHMNTAAYTQLINQYTTSDNYKDDFFILPNTGNVFSGPPAFQTLYLSDATNSNGAMQLDVPGNVLATCPFANTTENIASHVGAWDSVYSHRSLKSVSRTYRFGQETFEGKVGAVGWMSDNEYRNKYPGYSICAKNNILYTQYIGGGKLLIVAYTSGTYLERGYKIAAINSSGTISKLEGRDYCKIDVGYYLYDLQGHNYTLVNQDSVYWYGGGVIAGSPSTSIYSCDGRYVYFYDGHFRMSVLDLTTGQFTAKNTPEYVDDAGAWTLMGYITGKASYGSSATFYTWKSDDKSYYIRPAIYGYYSTSGGGGSSQRHVYVNNGVIYSGNGSGKSSSTSAYCTIVSATMLANNYLGCGLSNCCIADGVSDTSYNFETRKFYIGSVKWCGWFCVGGDNIYLYDAGSDAIKKKPISLFMSDLENCVIGNSVYIDTSTLENARVTSNFVGGSSGSYVCDEYTYAISTTESRLNYKTYGSGIFISGWDKTRCTSVYVLNEPLEKTFDDTLVVKYTISFDPNELLV